MVCEQHRVLAKPETPAFLDDAQSVPLQVVYRFILIQGYR
jgi:hypothetical protein